MVPSTNGVEVNVCDCLGLQSWFVVVCCCLVLVFCAGALCLFSCLCFVFYCYCSCVCSVRSVCLCVCYCVFVVAWLCVCWFFLGVYVSYGWFCCGCCIVFLLKLRNSRGSIENCGNGDGTINKRCWVPLMFVCCAVVLYCCLVLVSCVCLFVFVFYSSRLCELFCFVSLCCYRWFARFCLWVYIWLLWFTVVCSCVCLFVLLLCFCFFAKAVGLEERNRRLRKRRWYDQQKVLSSAYVIGVFCWFVLVISDCLLSVCLLCSCLCV